MGFFDIFKKKKKMSDGLEKTRTDFFQNIVNTLTSSVIDDDLYNDLEEQLILADVGPSCAVRLVDELRDEVEINGLHTGQEALDALRDIIRREVSPKTDLDLSGKPAVILVVGVNGVGKTTTIAKLAYLYKDLGKRVMLAAGDTFRAAASEQLETWADRAGVPLVKAGEGADPAAVIFDAVKSATARGYDMVIADTAGRLHNKKGLMDELSKISRSVKKARCQPGSAAGAGCHYRPERHQPGAGVLPRRRCHRRCADQAGRHPQGWLHHRCARKAGPAHPFCGRGGKDRRPDLLLRHRFCRSPAAGGSAA